jgi:hypothetical protein
MPFFRIDMRRNISSRCKFHEKAFKSLYNHKVSDLAGPKQWEGRSRITE